MSTAISRATPTVILVDDTRSFADGRACRVARTADDAIALLRRYQFSVIDQLWLEPDLGWLPDATPLTAQPVVDELVSAAADGCGYDIGEIRIHGTNPSGARLMKTGLQRAGYRVVRDYDLRTLRTVAPGSRFAAPSR